MMQPNVCVSFRKAGLLTLVLCILFFQPAAYSQTDTASISGSITDQTGAAVAAANITLTNVATGQQRTTTANDSGIYSFPNILPGNYTLVVEKSGFGKRSVSNVNLQVQQTIKQDVQLSLGSVSESVTVSADASDVAVQSETHEVSQGFDTRELVQLPTSGRNLLSVATLGPGTTPASNTRGNSGDSGFFGTSGSQVAVTGLPDTSTVFLQDGVENVALLTQTMNIIPSIESVQEVITTINGAPARYADPSVINVVTKGGTNNFHGTAYDFLQNDALNARNFFTAPSQMKPPIRYNLFGGNVSGPIVKNKLFFLFDYSGLRSSQSSSTLAVVPTAAEAGGNFSGVSQILYNPNTFNPVTGAEQPFTNNQIPASAINPFAQKWLGLYPSPNLTATATSNYNYGTNLTNTDNSNEYLGRVDYNISQADHLYGSVLYLNAPTAGQTIIPGLFGATHINIGTNGTIEETHVFGPTIVNTARIGYNRSNYFLSQEGTGKNYAGEYGLINVSPLPSQAAPPTISINGITSQGSPYTPQGAIQNRFQYADELDITLGKHTLYIGGELVRTQFYGNWTINNNAQYSFDGSFTSLYGVNGTTGAITRSASQQGVGLADFLLGYPNSASHSIGVTAGHFFDWHADGYIQDDYKILPKLTLNLGLRYDIYTPPVDNTLSTTYDFATGQNVKGAWQTNHGDIGPRFGFAYNWNSKLVVRGGYGIYYTENPYNNEQFELTYPPNFINQGYTYTIGQQTPLQNVFVPTPSAGNRGYTNGQIMKDTSAQEWNFTLQSALSSSLTLSVGYVGNVGRHETARYDGNQPIAATPGSARLNVLPYPSLGGPITTQGNFENSNYNGLLITLNKRLRNGLSFTANYTWSKALGYTSGDNDDVQDIHNLRYQYSYTNFDQPQVFNFSGVYDLPVGPGKHFLNNNGLLSRYVIGGWRTAGIWTLASATPVSVTANNNADTSYVASFYSDKVCNPYANVGQQTLSHWFNTSCFVQPATGQYGGSGNNGVRGPHTNNVDFSLSKIWPIMERAQLQFRSDFFNLFNHTQFYLSPENVNNTSQYGSITGAYPARSIQMSLRLSF
jgi:hypothetical protein